MLLQKEKIKKYIIHGDEIDAYVYRKNGVIWFVLNKNENTRNDYSSQLVLPNIFNCSYFVHTNIEEAERFLKDLIYIENILTEKNHNFNLFISTYWNSITDHLLYHWTDKKEELVAYIDKLLILWIRKLEISKKEFNILIEKKRTKFDSFTLWDDESLYEISKKYGFQIPEDVIKSKNSIMLENMSSKADELLTLLKKEDEKKDEKKKRFNFRCF